MAVYDVRDYLTLSTPNGHTHTDWEAYVDGVLVDSLYKSDVELLNWQTPLQNPNAVNECYYDKVVTVKIRFWADHIKSNWFTIVEDQEIRNERLTNISPYEEDLNPEEAQICQQWSQLTLYNPQIQK
jgi:hypothetical protein